MGLADTQRNETNKHDPFGGLAYFGFLGLFLGFMFLAVFLEAFAICQEENQPEEGDLFLRQDVPPRGPADDAWIR